MASLAYRRIPSENIDPTEDCSSSDSNYRSSAASASASASASAALPPPSASEKSNVGLFASLPVNSSSDTESESNSNSNSYCNLSLKHSSHSAQPIHLSVFSGILTSSSFCREFGYAELIDHTPTSVVAPICIMEESRTSVGDTSTENQVTVDSIATSRGVTRSHSVRGVDRIPDGPLLVSRRVDRAFSVSYADRFRPGKQRPRNLQRPSNCGTTYLEEELIELASPLINEPFKFSNFHDGKLEAASKSNHDDADADAGADAELVTPKEKESENANLSMNLNENANANDSVTAEQRQNAINDSMGLPQNNASRTMKEQLISFFQPSDNKLAIKLFGNKTAVQKERRRQQQGGFAFVIHPCSDFRFYWDLVMLVILASNVVILPVAISFFYEDTSGGWIVFNCISDTLFLLDILCNFRTGVITNDFAEQIMLDPKLIALHYIKTWFFLDIISSLPMDYMFLIINSDDNYSQLMHAGRALRILRLTKLLSLLRLLRFSRLVRYMSQWEEFLNIAAMLLRVLNLVLLILLLAHWNACLQFLIPALKEFPPDSWVALEEIEKAPWLTQYTWSMFRALSHMLCIGYGKYPPQSMSDAWSTMVSMLSGAISYAMFVGHATALVQSFDTSKRMYREKWKQVEEYMAFRKLPRNLRQRISNYYEHRYQGKMFDEEAILGELSECLREQIINYNCRALVAAVPFFTHADADFVSEVVTNLRFEVFQPEDIVIKAGTIGTKMYFIQEGTVEVILPNGTIATSLQDGAYFGEICLLVEGARRVATIRAVTYCNLYSLSNENFKQVLENYPGMRATMEQVAQERLHKIGNSTKVSNPQASTSSRHGSQ